jgi:hypothetical protein
VDSVKLSELLHAEEDNFRVESIDDEDGWHVSSP